jgi:Flp pilus assembly protein TadD
LAERARGLVWGAAAALVLLAWLSYAGALSYPPIWDDRYITTDNPSLDSWSSWWRLFMSDMWTTSSLREQSSFYRPVAMLSYLFNARIGGNSPASFRAGNVLLHSINAVLLFQFLRRLDPRRASVAVAAVTSGWFVVAGVNVETVTWLSARFDLLGTTFIVAGLLLRHDTSSAWRRCGAGVMLIAALLCKEAFICGVGIYVLHEVLLHRRERLSHLPEVAVVVVGLVGYFMARSAAGVPSGSVLSGSSLLELVGSYSFLIASYPILVLAPVSLDQFRLYTAPTVFVTTTTLVLAAAVFALCARVWWRTRRADVDGGDAPAWKRAGAVTFGVGFVLCGFAPLALTGPNLGMVGDRYAYFSSIGLYCVMAVGLSAGVERLRSRWPGTERALTVMLVALPCLMLAGQLLFQQTRLRDWRSPHALYEASVLRDRNNPHALYHLGHLLAVEGRLNEAGPLLRAAHAREPSSWRTINALCYLELNTDAPRAAVDMCRKAVQANDQNRRAWTNFANALMNAEQWPECLDAVDAALALGDHEALTHHIKGACLAKLGRNDEARRSVERALALDPNHPGALKLRAAMEAADRE